MNCLFHSFVLTLFSSVDLRERQTHHTGSERHGIQLRRHRKHIQSDVQGACGNLTQCQLHCMCHLKGQSELWNLKYVLKCINEPRLALTFCLLVFFPSLFAPQGPDSHYGTKGLKKVTQESATGTKTTFFFFSSPGNNNGTSVEDGQIPEIIYYTWTEHGVMQVHWTRDTSDCWEDWTAGDIRSASWSLGVCVCVCLCAGCVYLYIE